jgi:hypothetical protein
MLKNLTNEIKIEAAENYINLKRESDRIAKALAEAKKLVLEVNETSIETDIGIVKVSDRVTESVTKAQLVKRLETVDPNYNKFYAANKKIAVTKVLAIA